MTTYFTANPVNRVDETYFLYEFDNRYRVDSAPRCARMQLRRSSPCFPARACIICRRRCSRALARASQAAGSWALLQRRSRSSTFTAPIQNLDGNMREVVVDAEPLPDFVILLVFLEVYRNRNVVKYLACGFAQPRIKRPMSHHPGNSSAGCYYTPRFPRADLLSVAQSPYS
jgi:hypothetical protein